MNSITKSWAVTFVAALLSFSSLASKQETNLYTKYSFGFDASNIFNQLFRSQLYASSVYFSYKYNERSELRLGSDLTRVSGSSGKTILQGRFGYLRTFKSYHKWDFYAGIDALVQGETNENTKTESIEGGGLLFAGAKFYISPHFSIDTEPSLYVIFRQSRDNDAFGNKISKINKQGFTNIGLVRLTYHF